MALTQVSGGSSILASDINQFYNLLRGVAASGESITLVYNAAGSVVIQPSSDPSAGTEAIQIKNNAGTVLSSLTFDGRVLAAAGGPTAPTLSFETDADTGFYRAAANQIGVTVNGANVGSWDATSLIVGTATGSKVIVAGTLTAGGLLTSAVQVATSGPLIYSGSGAPSISAAVKGSLYLRSDGSSTSTRAYIATDTAGTWTAITTAA